MAGRVLHLARGLCRRPPRHYRILSHPELTRAMRHGNKEQALKLFDEIARSKDGPCEEVFNNMLRFCQEIEDSQQAEKVMSMVLQKCPRRDNQLSTVLINCQSAFGWYSEAWQEYQRLLAQGQTIREGVLKVLLNAMAAEGETEKVVELLEMMENRMLSPDPVLSKQLLKMSVDKSEYGRPVFEAVMKLYRKGEVLVERELTELAEECLKRYWGTVSATEARIINGQCSICAHRLEANCISGEECDYLRNDFDGLISKELKSFGSSSKDFQELNEFKQFITQYGPFAAVIDGLNVSSRGGNRKAKLLANLNGACKWVSNTLGPGLLVLRAHFAKTASSGSRRTITLEEIRHQLRQINIRTFITRNKVKDDHYTVYGCLCSGPEAYFVSNDQLGDIFSEIPLKERVLYLKWLRSRQIGFDKNETGWHFNIPMSYTTRVQWTEAGYHLPLKDSTNLWMCLRTK